MPDENLGDIVSDLQQRRAIITRTQNRGNGTVIEAHAPLANLFGYSNAMRGLSQGARHLHHGARFLRAGAARSAGRVLVRQVGPAKTPASIMRSYGGRMPTAVLAKVAQNQHSRAFSGIFYTERLDLFSLRDRYCRQAAGKNSGKQRAAGFRVARI